MERKPFEITIGQYELALTAGMCAVALFRRKQEVDYIAVDLDGDQEGETMRIFNNPDVARWMAGYTLEEKDGNLYRVMTHREGHTFREVYGWNPAVIEREEPSQWEEDAWVEVNFGSDDGFPADWSKSE